MIKKKRIELLFNEILYYSKIFENNSYHDHALYSLFFQFYAELFKIGINSANFTLDEIVNDIIYPSNIIFYIGKNLGIIDNIQTSQNKDDLLLIKEFHFVKYIKLYRKITKENYVNTFIIFEKLFSDFQQNLMDIEDLDYLFHFLKEIIFKYDTNYIYIEIFLLNLEMINIKKEVLNYILDKTNIELFGDLFPILDKIFYDAINDKFSFRGIQNNKNYFQFNSDIFSEINNNCIKNEDTLGEMVFFYFENKVMNELNKKEKEERNYIERNIENLRYYLQFLEKNYYDIKKGNFLSIIFAVAFLKCYIYKVIKSIQENDENFRDFDYLFKDVLKFKENSSKISPFITSIKLYILKLLIYSNGNFSDIRELDLSKFWINDFKDKLDSIEKEFGFDYMLLPIQLDTNINIYNSIIQKFFNKQNIFNDKNIIKEINNNVDILYCLFANFHFSYFYNKNYFFSQEYDNAKHYYFSEIKDNYLKDELIKKIFDYFICLETKNIYKNFNYFNYDQILSLLISARFVISIISSKNEKCLFYNLLINVKETINNNKKYFNEYYLRDFDIEINNRRNINCLTYTIINYILLSHFFFGFKLNLIKYDDIKYVNLFKELKEKNEKETTDYLMAQLFKEFLFIKKILLPLLGINNIIIFMNSLFEEINKKLLIFQIDDDDEKIISNESSIDFIVNTVLINFSNLVNEYYAKGIKPFDENNNIVDKNEIVPVSDMYDMIMEKSEFYNDKNLINEKYPLLYYLTYSNYTSLNNDFKNQYFYFNFNSSSYPLISCVLSNDDIFKIIELIPKLNEFANKVYNTLNMRYTEGEIKSKTIKDIFNYDLDEHIQMFNSIIETNYKLFDQRKKINAYSKIFEIINLPGSCMNYVYKRIIEKYNSFLSKMTLANLENIIFDKVVIMEAKENDYNFNYILINDYKITIKEKLEELSLLYSKRTRKIKDKINVYDGGKIIYDFNIIEKKLEELFIFGRKKFSEEHIEFIFSSDIFKQEFNIIKDFEKKYSQNKINDDEKKKMKEYINNIKFKDYNILNFFYELFFVFKYIIQNSSDIKMKNENDLIKYLELKKYDLTNLKNAKRHLKDYLSLNTILYFYVLVKNESFEYFTKDIQRKIKEKGIKISEEIIENIDQCLIENKIIKIENIISAMKIYILRNIKDKDIDSYLFDLNDLKNKDLWDMDIYESKEFNEEFNELVKLDKDEEDEKDVKNVVVIYLYSKIYDIEILEDSEEEEEIIL